MWVDLETTGLDPSKDLILEVCMVLAKGDGLQPVSSFEEVVHAFVDLGGVVAELGVDPVVVEMHTRSGLFTACKYLGKGETLVRQRLAAWLDEVERHGVVLADTPLGGSSVGFDRSFLSARWPEIEQRFHYRNVDISTVKEMARRWRPDVFESRPAPKARHRAYPDILDTLAEARHYRKHLFTKETTDV